ncbi:MAG: hypothetical protein GOMPHAMPRED_004667 [Gomphillus americanus]|uniref:Uncharacterized protein n=1 Tax=Gomphillus americanus TaxID=1940652 RepID=A0A8H3IVG9_9LECA|nr:MAG: hypothetical protein GOMPHAMPRED_004667 [Gomphillus americanus]
MTQLHVLDLPPLYTHPSSSQILDVLEKLVLEPASFAFSPQALAPVSTPSIDEGGILRYLTSIISSSLDWIEDDSIKEEIWEKASQRIAERAGRSAAPSLTRTFTLTIDAKPAMIHLHEPTLTSDNLGHKTWSSSYLLATELGNLAHHLPVSGDHPCKVLELGSGTGLFGIAFAAQFRHSQVLLTDLPDILPNLARNVNANAELVTVRHSSIIAATLDWNDAPELYKALVPSSTAYDVVLAADPIYSPSHPELLTRAVAAHIARERHARVLLGLPLRDAYLPQVEHLWTLLQSIGLRVLEQGEMDGFDDWLDGQGERVVVRVRWAVWAWRDEK